MANSSWTRLKQPRQATGASWEGGGGRENSRGGFLCKKEKKKSWQYDAVHVEQVPRSKSCGCNIHPPFSIWQPRPHKWFPASFFIFSFYLFFQLQLHQLIFPAHLTCRGLQRLWWAFFILWKWAVMQLYHRHPIKPNDLVGNCERFETDVILFIYFFSEGNLSVCVRCSNKGGGGGGMRLF